MTYTSVGALFHEGDVHHQRRAEPRSVEFVFQRYQPMLLALLCTPALAVRNFRPTLLRPRAPHLRTAALRPACIALDPDLQPVGDTEAVTWPFCARLHRRCTETFFLLTVDSCVISVCDAGVM